MRREKTVRVIALLLFSIILTSFTSVFVFSTSFDYSYESAPLKKVITADELLESQLGINMTDAEKKYLKTADGFTISFNSHIPTTSVLTEYCSETDILNVKALEYKYTAENGAVVIWRPVSVALDDLSKPLSSPDYTAEFSNVGTGNSESVIVEYTTDFVIPELKINELLNLAYTNAPLYDAEITEKTFEYRSKLEKYLSDFQKYEAYILALEGYTDYLSEKRIYDEKYYEYTNYLLELEEYKREKAEHDSYITALEKYHADYAIYISYLAYASVNQSMIDAYERYSVNIEVARAQLNIIHSTKKNATSLKRSVYSAIMGDTVTSVIANKDAIANNLTGADPAAVDLAGVATENLRRLYNSFFGITDEREQYNYYVTNYEAFRDNFANLFKALDKLYMNSKVRGILKAEEKQEKYLILLAELYYVTNALSDVPVTDYDGTAFFDSSYIIGKGYTDEDSPLNIMEGEVYIKDENAASPLSDGYPVAVPKPEYTKMDEPVKPSPVSAPVEPESVPAPVLPKPVVEPEYVSNPGAAPVEYIPDTVHISLIEAYKNGELSQRDHHTGDLTISPKINVIKKFVNIKTVNVIFYDRECSDKDNAEILYEISVDQGTYADYPIQLPKKREDSRYLYTHIGWSDVNGVPIDISAVSSDISLYPIFKRTEKEYTTIWFVDGVQYTEEPEAPVKAPEGNFQYVFIGWKEAWSDTDSVLNLAAEFEEKYVLETESGGAEIGYGEVQISATVGSNQGPYKVEDLIALASGERGISIVTAKGTLEFSYAETIALKRAGVVSLDLSVLRRADGEYNYGYHLYDRYGEEVTSQIKASITAPCINEDAIRLALFYKDADGMPKQLKSICNGREISFSAVAGRLYYTLLEYKITFLELSEISISVDRSVAKKGNTVAVSVAAPNGVRIDKVYFMNSVGEKTEILNGSFIMPSDDVTVGVDYTIEEYTVTFVSEGKTIMSYICRYGDTVTPPNDPCKESSENFEYTFIGWSEDVVPVTESVVYTAVYARRVITQNKNTGLQITPAVLRLIILAVTLLILAFLVIAPSLVMTVVLIKKRKSKLKIKR